MTAAVEVAPGTDMMSVDGEVLVFDGTMIHLMSGSGAEIWRAVDGRRSRDEIVDQLAAQHPATAGVADDVRAYLDDLVARGLLVEGLRKREDGYVVPEHVGWVIDGGHVVVLDLLSGERHSLSTTASRIWSYLGSGMPETRMVDRLRDEFPDAPASLESDVAALVQDLRDRGLLVETAGSRP